MNQKIPTLSLVICTHRRFHLLELAIQSLCDQKASKNSFEVIIVDNDLKPNPEVKKLVEKAENKINIKYIFESNLGLSFARNTGGKFAKSNYIGYIDDDAKVPKHYINKAIEIINELAPDIFGGPHIAFYLSKKPKWFKDEYGSSPQRSISKYYKCSEFISGMNIVFRKNILDRVGWFDPELGMSGKKVWYGEETMVQVIAWQLFNNLKVYHDHDLFVEHLVPSHKMKITDKIKRSYSIGASQAYMWLEKGQIVTIRNKAPMNLLKIVLRLFINGLPGLFFRNRKKYRYWQNYAYEVLSHFFASIGQEWRYIRNRTN